MAVDADGQSAIQLAGQFGHKACERQLVQFTWQQRAASCRPHGPLPPLLPHQRFDSALRASLLDGPEAQVYRPQLVPSGEFIGTGLDSPRRKVKAPGTGSTGRQAQSRSSSAQTSSHSVQYPFYSYSSSDWLALIGDEPQLGTSTPAVVDCKTSPTPHQPRRQVASHVTDDDVINAVIQRKKYEQQVHGLAGLPYDLWLTIADRTELFQALKEQGKLDAVLVD